MKTIFSYSITLLPMPSNEPYRHLLFLYIWAEQEDETTPPATWRYRVEDPLTHEQHLFSDLESLWAFLKAREEHAWEKAQPIHHSEPWRKE